MKKTIIALAALAFMAWGCSSSDDDGKASEKKSLLTQGTSERPTWVMPNFDDYEQTMFVRVQLQDTLQSYASDQDMLCATIDKDVCGVANAKLLEDQWVFDIHIGSNDTRKDITLLYYCDKIRRIFTIEWGKFDTATPPTGEGDFYQPTFIPND